MLFILGRAQLWLEDAAEEIPRGSSRLHFQLTLFACVLSILSYSALTLPGLPTLAVQLRVQYSRVVPHSLTSALFKLPTCSSAWAKQQVDPPCSQIVSLWLLITLDSLGHLHTGVSKYTRKNLDKQILATCHRLNHMKSTHQLIFDS